jgi:threonine aldolase
MRQAMAEAVVGDDVWNEDPTVIELERRTAEMLGKEAALYVPSGTMSNQVALRSHTEPGEEIITDADAHVYFYEAGAPAALAGVSCRLAPAQRGIFSADQVRQLLRPRDVHFTPTKLIWIEQTHNRGGGSIWPLETIAELSQLAQQQGLRLHMDGARLWNASAATGISEQRYAQHCDSVSVCFSKGLGAPVGSAVVGSREFIQRARRFRKQYGGGMRQAGIIAAGALYALQHHRQRLAEDHAHARLLAEGLAALPGVEVDLEGVQTNIVVFGLKAMPAAQLVDRAKQQGVLVLCRSPDTIRAVTSLEVGRQGIQRALDVFRTILSNK